MLPTASTWAGIAIGVVGTLAVLLLALALVVLVRRVHHQEPRPA